MMKTLSQWLLPLLVVVVLHTQGCWCAIEYSMAYNENGCPISAINPLISGINSATTAVAELNGVPTTSCFPTAYSYSVSVTCTSTTSYTIMVDHDTTCGGTSRVTSSAFTNDQCTSTPIAIGASNTAYFHINCYSASPSTIYADHGFYASGSSCTNSFSSPHLVAEFSGVVASNPSPVCHTAWGSVYNGATPTYKSYKIECSDDLSAFQIEVFQSSDCTTNNDILNAPTGGCICSTTTSTCFSVTCSSSSIAVGDPRFVGFRGQKFAVTGTPGYVYNLLSDTTVQYNSRFIHFGRQTVTYVPSKGADMRSNVTFIGEVGVKFVDSAETEHRFHLNIFHPTLPSFTRALLLKSAPSNSNNNDDELYHRHLDTNALQEILHVVDEKLHALYLEFDGARHSLSLSLPESPLHHSREPLFRSSLRLSACGGRCHVKVHNGTNLISVGGPDLPATFWFAIVISVHGELYINEKIEPHTRDMTFSNNVHGIVGYTYRSNIITTNDNSTNDGEIQHSVSYEDLDDEYYLDMLQERTSSSSSHAHHHPHRRTAEIRNKEDEWKFLEASKYLEGQLADYELDASHDVWTDSFTFNQYQLPN